MEWLRQGKAPSVLLKHPTKIVSLSWRVGNKKTCTVREMPEGAATLALLGERLSIPYSGQGAPGFGFAALMKLLRRKRGIAPKLEEGMCVQCGAPAQEQDHHPQQARNTEESPTQNLCATCHADKTQQEALFDDGWRPLVSVLSPQTLSLIHI